jgi:hypothetical protein
MDHKVALFLKDPPSQPPGQQYLEKPQINQSGISDWLDLPQIKLKIRGPKQNWILHEDILKHWILHEMITSEGRQPQNIKS